MAGVRSEIESHFCRFTQLGLPRLVTTAAAMDGKPLTLDQAWVVYDRFSTIHESLSTANHFS
jgi:hypothetical protein